MMLMAEKVPNLPFEADKLNCGVRGRKCCVFEAEMSVALDEVPSYEGDFKGYNAFGSLLPGEGIENVLGVARYVELVYDPYSRARSVLTNSPLAFSEPSLVVGRNLRGVTGDRQLISMKLFLKGDAAVEMASPMKDRDWENPGIETPLREIERDMLKLWRAHLQLCGWTINAGKGRPVK
jgi:hypothetical protein